MTQLAAIETRRLLQFGRYRTAFRALAGSTANMAFLALVLGISFATTGAPWYFLPGLAGCYLLLLALEYTRQLRQLKSGA